MIKIILALLVSCLLSGGQAFTQNDLPWLASPAPANSLPDGIEFRWVASDLNGVTPLNYNWVDRIQGQFFKYDTINGWTAPVVTANSVTFAGNSSITNNLKTYTFPHNSGTFRTLVYLLKPTAGHANVHQGYYTDTTDAGFASISTHSDGVLYMATSVPLAQGPGTNAFSQSWILTQTTVAASGSIHLTGYTNGVATLSPTTLSQFTYYRVGGTVTVLLWADIYEIICFTNATRGFNASEVAQIETYRLAHYP